MRRHNQRDRENPGDTRPFLSIPYWISPVIPGGTWDTGVIRPLPSNVISYKCDAIRTSPYRPGERLDIEVDVLNSGGGDAASIATVVVYWANPTVGFANPTFLAATTVSVRPSRTVPQVATARGLSGTIPATAPNHICLLVSVSHPQDRAGTVCDPINDRHWAQRNLDAVALTAGIPQPIMVQVANPFARTMVFDLRVAPADEMVTAVLAHAFMARPTNPQARLHLLDANGSALTDPGEEARTSLELGALEQTRIEIVVESEAEMEADERGVLEVQMFDREGERLVGSLGVMLEPARRE